MDTEGFWRVLDAAKNSDKPLDVAVVDHLSLLPAEEILAFDADSPVYATRSTAGTSGQPPTL
jgi:hypothetical protein